MGLKHEARAAAAQASIPIVPGSNGVLVSISDALEAAKQVGYPVILKATAGGGGLGMVVCNDEKVLQERFLATQASAKTLFGTGSLLIEKYIPAARHIEIQISTGLTITPFFDGLLCKVIVTGQTREEALTRFAQALDICKVYGPPNNLQYLKAIVDSDKFRDGNYTTSFLDNFVFTPRALTVISPGIECTVQDLPGRTVGCGVPRGSPMDALAFSAGNRLVDNPVTLEGLEILIVPTIACELEFSSATVVAITGKEVKARVNDTLVAMWSRITVPSSGKLKLEVEVETEKPDSGFRVYICIRGGLPNVPVYLGSKSTSMGLGGYQGRSLLPGDQLTLGFCGPLGSDETSNDSIDFSLIPKYSSDWTIYVLPGPQDDKEFLSSAGQNAFYSTKWHVSKDINRLGIRLSSSENIQWARENGGEGGSHPSNILDNGYTLGTINLNGDTPVILTNDGPDMGGFLMIHQISLDWDGAVRSSLKEGKLLPELRLPWDTDTTRDYESAISDQPGYTNFFKGISRALFRPRLIWRKLLPELRLPWDTDTTSDCDAAILSQAGDAAILVDFGSMRLDLNIRARIHAFQKHLTAKRPAGLRTMNPCIRSVMVSLSSKMFCQGDGAYPAQMQCHYDPKLISQPEFLSYLITAQESLPSTMTNMEFLGRRITLPIVLDDPWNKEALQRYMATMRRDAIYLPSNIEYLGKNNGLEPLEALQRLVQTDWLVLGVGFYLGCPFLVPIDPRCRLVAQKMNPSRTYTPRGAVGLAGPVAAIYPIESPGGYQLYGRTLPPWQTWGKGDDFNPDKPWLLEPFDQIHFEVIHTDNYAEIERAFDSGTYKFKIEPKTFSVKECNEFERETSDEAMVFRNSQRNASMIQERRERELLAEWQREKQAEMAHAQVLSVEFEDTNQVTTSGTLTEINSPLSASVWKIKCRPGDRIRSASDVLLILEAMKTEIAITSGEENVGKVVKKLGKEVVEGGSVRL
ncbi:hypothetical protein C0992_005252, partial [Termitomyces sp. T32_za158]